MTVPVYAPERDARLLELYAKDWTYTAIAGELGLTKNQVAGLIHRSGPAQEIKRTRKRRPPNFQPVLLTGLAAIEARTGGDQVSTMGCRWIYGHTSEGIGHERQPSSDWHWCGAERMPDSVYCAAHHAAAYRKLPESEEKAA